MKQGQETKQIWTQRREHMTHTTEDWHYSPLPKGSSRALTVPSGRGGGRSGGPSGQIRTRTQDGDLQSGTDRQGPWRSWELWRPWRYRELWRPWQMVYSRNAYYPPKKISLGKWGGIRSPPGLNRQDKQDREALQGQTDRTVQNRNALQGQTDRTGQPTGTRSPPGLAWRLRLHLGMTRSQRPTQGPSATASISATRGLAARMASMATTRGAACPRRVSMD